MGNKRKHKPSHPRPNLDEVTKALSRLSPVEFAEVVRRGASAHDVFGEPWIQSHFVLGIASRERKSDEGEPELWEDWELELVAPPDEAKYEGAVPDEQLPRWFFCQAGACDDCCRATMGIMKHGVCPVCGGRAYGT